MSTDTSSDLFFHFYVAREETLGLAYTYHTSNLPQSPTAKWEVEAGEIAELMGKLVLAQAKGKNTKKYPVSKGEGRWGLTPEGCPLISINAPYTNTHNH